MSDAAIDPDNATPASTAEAGVAPLEGNAVEAAMRETRRAWRLGLVLSVVAAPVALAPAFLAYEIFERALPERDPPMLFWLALFIAAAVGFSTLFEVARIQALSRAGAWLQRRLAEPALERAFERRLTAKGRARALDDLAILRASYTGAAVRGFLGLPLAAFAIAGLFWLDPWFGFGALGLNAVAAAFIALQSRYLWDAGARLERFGEATAARLSGVLRNAETVRALGLWGALTQKAREPGERAAAAARDLGDGRAWSEAVSGGFERAALALGLALAGWLVLSDRIGVGAGVAAAILISPAVRPVLDLARGWSESQAGRRAEARLRALFDEALPARGARVSPSRAAAAAPLLEAEGLVYRAEENGRPIIEGVSLAVRGGEILAVVGRSGAGKSTLCGLLTGALRPESGAVRFGGAPLSDWQPDALATQIGYLPQVVDLFDGRVNENIARMGEGGAVQILEAARSAGIHDAIRALPEGYDYFVGEGGRRLSAGYRQRVGLARALYGAPPVVVLDEPGAHLDQTGEKALIDTLIELKARGAAVILASHAPSQLARADRLLVLRDGRTVLSGEREFILRELYGGTLSAETRAAAPLAAAGE